MPVNPSHLPTNWYDDATTLINQSLEQFGAQDLEIDQHVQTNATLINNDWCDCFRRNEIVVGISVDGPEDIHDAHRRFRNGRGSHAMAMRGIEALTSKSSAVPLHLCDHCRCHGTTRAYVPILSRQWHQRCGLSMLKRRKESIHHLPWQAQTWRLSIKIFSERFGD